MEFDGKSFAARLPTRPGIYLMRDGGGKPLYVGKARNLRKRVASYFDARPKVDRIMRMVARISQIEVSLTRTEGEALLLENEWIKSLKPRYNVLLRDDKSYPWIVMTTSHEFPQISFHRGARDKSKSYFGPYPSASSVRESINLIQKLFRIRNCEDSYFAHRNRPCLQYQIRRCTAPCVGLVSQETYSEQVKDAMLFLQGKNQKVLTRMISRMEQAAAGTGVRSCGHVQGSDQCPETDAGPAICFRQPRLTSISSRWHRNRVKPVFSSCQSGEGETWGNAVTFPSQTEGYSAAEVLEAFLGQYYQDRQPPAQIVVSQPLKNEKLMASVFSERAGHKISIQAHPRGDRRKMLELAVREFAPGFADETGQQGQHGQRNSKHCKTSCNSRSYPNSVECFDISHTAGNQTVGSCVVFDNNGPVKSKYRRYNLKGITPGDDYAAMHQVLTRRYGRIQAEEGSLPDLLIIDGGKGQLRQAEEVLAEFGLAGIPLLGIAKGRARRAGHEEWILASPSRSFRPGPESPASHLVQQIRDESHRFAITGHRGRRQKAATKSRLEKIPGIGPGRRRALLNHFGGLQGVNKAGVEELSSVPGISRVLAEEIFRALH